MQGPLKVEINCRDDGRRKHQKSNYYFSNDDFGMVDDFSRIIPPPPIPFFQASSETPTVLHENIGIGNYHQSSSPDEYDFGGSSNSGQDGRKSRRSGELSSMGRTGMPRRYKGSRRSPLTPLGLSELPHNPQSFFHFQARTLERDCVPETDHDTNQSLAFDTDKTSFVSEHYDLMDVTIVIYSLNGIVSERLDERPKRSKNRVRDKIYKTFWGDPHTRVSESTISSSDPSSYDDGSSIERIGTPTLAVVSYEMYMDEHQENIETYLPSIAIAKPVKRDGLKSRYQALWPSAQSMLTRDELSVLRSSVKLTKNMKQEMYTTGVIGCNYVHEKIELQIKLFRGTEILQMGTATVGISGEEEGEIQMVVPIKPSKSQRKSGNKKKIETKPIDYGFFRGDPARRYFLDDNATLKVGIRVLQKDGVAGSEYREQKENELQEFFRNTNHLQPVMKTITELQSPRNGKAKSGVKYPHKQDVTSNDDLKPPHVFQELFSCNALECTVESESFYSHDDEDEDIPRVVQTRYFENQEELQILSSVSESKDGSEHSSDSENESAMR